MSQETEPSERVESEKDQHYRMEKHKCKICYDLANEYFGHNRWEANPKEVISVQDAIDFAHFVSSKQSPPQDKWVSVKERLPETKWADEFPHISGMVNILTELNIVGSAAYNSETKIWFMGGLSKETGYLPFERIDITHWQPIPEPPKL